MVQLVSHVTPASGENACSHVGFAPGFAFHQMKRISTDSPRNVSSAKNTPVPPSNFPTTGTSR